MRKPSDSTPAHKQHHLFITLALKKNNDEALILGTGDELVPLMVQNLDVVVNIPEVDLDVQAVSYFPHCHQSAREIRGLERRVVSVSHLEEGDIIVLVEFDTVLADEFFAEVQFLLVFVRGESHADSVLHEFSSIEVLEAVHGRALLEELHEGIFLVFEEHHFLHVSEVAHQVHQFLRIRESV